MDPDQKLKRLPMTDTCGSSCASELRAYIGCKIVRAMPMDHATFLSTIAAEKYNPHAPLERDRPPEPGFLVIYEDGYKSWSPAGAFSRAYRPVSRSESEMLR